MAFAGESRFLESAWAHGLYICAVLALIVSCPPSLLGNAATSAVLVIGAIGAWRYSWGLSNFIRSVWYRKRTFPKMRFEADTLFTHTEPAPYSFFLVTSFRIDALTSAKVYRGAFEAARNAPGGATVVSSIVENGDRRLVKRLYALGNYAESGVRLKFIQIDGSGKRDALAEGFKAIAKLSPAKHDILAVIDGDSIVPPDLVQRCAPFFLLEEKIGALTTDETCEVQGREVFRQWYSLRFAQRHVMMASMGLSRRVLTLTGRMSMFRAQLATSDEFIRQIQVDYIDHWRLGRFRFLTGDDKSSWFWLLKNGYQMLYVPDVSVTTIEQPPNSSFVTSAAVLMVRWFGNMLRTNGRAIALGPSRIGWYTWWAVLDQRLSMWTCLFGLMISLIGAIFINPAILAGYAVWVLASRYVMCLFLFSARDRISIAYPFFLYFNQIFGSIIKTYVFFHLDRQKWTRQKTEGHRSSSSFRIGLNRWSSHFMHTFSLIFFSTSIAVFLGVLPSPTAWLPQAFGVWNMP
jgi:mannuronan synthase